MEKFEVIYYSGSSGDEYPRYIKQGEKRFPVKRILSSAFVFDSKSDRYYKKFLVETGDKRKFLVIGEDIQEV